MWRKKKKKPSTNHIHTFIHQSSDPSNMRRGRPGLRSIHAPVIRITAVSFYCKRVPKTSHAGDPRCAAWTHRLPTYDDFFRQFTPFRPSANPEQLLARLLQETGFKYRSHARVLMDGRLYLVAWASWILSAPRVALCFNAFFFFKHS